MPRRDERESLRVKYLERARLYRAAASYLPTNRQPETFDSGGVAW